MPSKYKSKQPTAKITAGREASPVFPRNELTPELTENLMVVSDAERTRPPRVFDSIMIISEL